MNSIDLKTKKMTGNQKCDLSIESGNYKIMFWSVPVIFKGEPFSIDRVKEHFHGSLSDILPYLVFGGYCVLEKDGKALEIAADYYAHARVYYAVSNDSLSISDDWREIPHENLKLNVFQLLYFLNWDSTLNGETYFDELKYFSPTYLYRIHENGVTKEFVPMPNMNTASLLDSMKETLSAIVSANKKTGVLLSGGVDSSQIALAAKQGNRKLQYLCAHIDDIELFDNEQDEMGAIEFSGEEKLDLEVVDVTIRDFLNGWNGQLTKSAAFAYKDGRLWQGIAGRAGSMGYEILMNGQNADAVYNYSYTGNSDFDKSMRSVSTDTNLFDVFTGKDTEPVVSIWKKYNKDEISRENFLAWLIVKGNGYGDYKGLAVDKACGDTYRLFYKEELGHRMRELLELYDNGKLRSPRHLLLEGKMVGYVDGEDTRCICGACEANGVRSIQVYTTPLVYDAMINVPIDEEDVESPKKISRKVCEDSAGFRAAQRIRQSVPAGGKLNPSQVWGIVYDILDEEFNFSETTKTALALFGSYGLFDEEKLKEVMAEDVGLRLRVAWVGLIYGIYSDSCKRDN